MIYCVHSEVYKAFLATGRRQKRDAAIDDMDQPGRVVPPPPPPPPPPPTGVTSDKEVKDTVRFESIRQRPWRLDWHNVLEKRLRGLSPLTMPDIVFAPPPSSHVDLSTLVMGGDAAGRVYRPSEAVGSDCLLVGASCDSWNGRCHDAAHMMARLPLHRRRARIVTGVALSEDCIWRPHSWLTHEVGVVTAAPASPLLSSSSVTTMAATVTTCTASTTSTTGPATVVLYELTRFKFEVYFGKECDCKDCVTSTATATATDATAVTGRLDELVAALTARYPPARHARLLRSCFDGLPRP
jgi:hypothetical protein